LNSIIVKRGDIAVNIRTRELNGITVAIVQSTQKLIADAQSALDLMMSVQYETNCSRIAINKEAVSEDFFILSTGLAGQVLQKFVNYQVKLAVFGDFSRYTSKPLKDFIFESNRGRDVFFVPDEDAAVEKLCGA
jgi:hypothetical protein